MPPDGNIKEIEMLDISISKKDVDISQRHVPKGNCKVPLKIQTTHLEKVRPRNILKRQRIVTDIPIGLLSLVLIHIFIICFKNSY